MAASETVRLRLQFDYPPPATPQCTVFWLLVDLDRCRVVTDLISMIRQRFGFSSGALLGLYLDGGLLPPAESARLVRDNDCLRVKLEESGIPENLVFINSGGDSPFLPRKAKKRGFRLLEDDETELGYRYSKKLGKMQNSGHHDQALDLEPEPITDKPERKKSQRKSKVTCGTGDEDNGETKRNSAKRKKKSESKKQTRNSKSSKAELVKDWPTQNCTPPKGSPRNSLAKSRRKGRAGSGPKGATTSSDSESSHESNSDDHSSATSEVDNPLKNLSAELLKEGLSTETIAAKKQASKSPILLSFSKGKATRTSSSSSDSSSDSDDQCVVSKNTSKCAAGLLQAVGFFAGQGCPGPGSSSQTPSASEWKLSDPTQTPVPPPSVSVPTSLGKGWGRGEDFLPWKGARGRGMQGKGRGRGRGGHGVSCILNRNTVSQKQQQLSEIVTNTSKIIQNPVEIHKKDYSLLPLLAAAPQVGEKIAFKLLELTSNYSPDVSDYKEGKILSHNPETQQVDIEILSSLPDLKEPGKFDLVYHNENGTEIVEYAVTQEKKISVMWKELIEPRLIIESSSNISSTEELV